MMNNNNFNNNNFNNNANAMDNEFLDWDGSFVAEESQFTTLKDGDYPFEVTKIERKMYDGNSQKIPNGVATLTIHKYTGRDGQERSNNQVKKFKKGGQPPQAPAQQAPQGYQQPVQQQQQPVQPQQVPQQAPNNDPFPGAF